MKLKILAIAITLILTVSTFVASATIIDSDDMRNVHEAKPFWEQINDDGFGSKYNIAPRGIEVFQNYLVVGTWNFKNLNYFGLPINTLLREMLENRTLPSGYEISKRLESDGCEIWCYDGADWRQIVGNNEEAIMPAGFGNTYNLDCSILIEHNGYLYAGLWNPMEGGQIWRTKDIDDEWEMVVYDGFGDESNVAPWVAEIFQGNLYIGTMNFEKGCDIFRTTDGVHWDAVVGGLSNTKPGFGTKDNYYAWEMRVYKSCLYVGTDSSLGCELWKSHDGITWEPVIAFGKIKAKLQGLAFPKGFGRRSFLDGIRRMAVFDDELYLGLTRPFFGKITFKNRFSSMLFSIPLSFPLGAQIWKYNAVDDQWARVVGGMGKRSNCNGFGNSKNIEIWSMDAFNDYLYAGTMCPETPNIILRRNSFLSWSIIVEKPYGKAELWRSDGVAWEQVVGDEAHATNKNNAPSGFGDEYNWGFRIMKVYNSSLIVGTVNVNTGCEMWKYSI